MAKPSILTGYSEEITRNCERVLVTLLRNLGPWKNSIFLIGGLTPRYLVKARPPEVPQHAGTLDLDVVIDLVILEDSHSWIEARRNNFAETIIFSQYFDGNPMITGFFSKVCPADADAIRWSWRFSGEKRPSDDGGVRRSEFARSPEKESRRQFGH
jgi:hypothetical protein